jgi:heptosyltransferase-2
VSRAAKLLVVGPSWVGDMVMAQSLYRMLAERPESPEIHVLAPPWSLPVLARMPEVARGVAIDIGHGALELGIRRRIARDLRTQRYDQAIVLPRSLKAALVPFLARIPKRTGYLGEYRYGLINDVRPFDKRVLNMTVLRFMALGLEQAARALPEIPAPRLRVDADARAQAMRRLELDADRPAVALMPGAEYGPAKRWPAPAFAALAARLASDGVAVWILGSAKERPLAQDILTQADRPLVRNLCGDSTLPEVIDLLSAARAAVSNDSGLMHIAAAVGTHVVAIYGSSSPQFTPPLTDNKTVFYEGLSCSPCFARTCPLQHMNCLNNIGVDAVFAATAGALQTPRPDSKSGRG